MGGVAGPRPGRGPTSGGCHDVGHGNHRRRARRSVRDVSVNENLERLMSPPLIATIPRPSLCPFCGSRAVDTLAKVITVTTYWRCRGCDKTWTIASQTAPPRRA